MVATGIAAGLVGGEAFSIDASLIRADVDRMKRLPGDQPIDWPKPEAASRAVRDYLAALDAARAPEDGGNGGSGGDGKPAKQVSTTDPQASWVGRKDIKPFFAYDANYLIDNKAGVIVDGQGTRANRSDEIAVTETMVERVERCFDLKPDRLAADTGNVPSITGNVPSISRDLDQAFILVSKNRRPQRTAEQKQAALFTSPNSRSPSPCFATQSGGWRTFSTPVPHFRS